MGGGTTTCPLDVSNNASTATRKTPFSMTYEARAVIPLEIGFPMLRTSAFTSDGNDELLKKSLDLIEERREKDRKSVV